MKAKQFANDTRKVIHLKSGEVSQRNKPKDSSKPQKDLDTGLGPQSSAHQQIVKEMSSITQMGIVNIENHAMNRISPLKRGDSKSKLTGKIIEEVSEENQSQSAQSIKK